MPLGGTRSGRNETLGSDWGELGNGGRKEVSDTVEVQKNTFPCNVNKLLEMEFDGGEVFTTRRK